MRINPYFTPWFGLEKIKNHTENANDAFAGHFCQVSKSIQRSLSISVFKNQNMSIKTVPFDIDLRAIGFDKEEPGLLDLFATDNTHRI
jgi:hypothetical protein